MMVPIKELLASHNTNLTKVSHKSRINEATLKQPINTWTIHVLNSVAKAINEAPETVLYLLQDESFALAVSDQSQIIQGVKFSDSETYRNIKFIAKSNIMEGWHPFHADINELKEFTATNHPELGQKFNDIFGDHND